MSAERKKILDMLAEGKITADEADRLLAALDPKEPRPVTSATASETPRSKPKYLRVQVAGGPDTHRRHKNVDIKIPLVLLKAGVKLGSLMPGESKAKLVSSLSEKGIVLDLNDLNGEKLDTLIAALTETSIDIDADDEKVTICCE
ncbi:MAG: hypothetical protein RBT76_08895 [candidate division Zixibacteria bacterium]|jgi:hypothetical protein|nr:hypothetical protein [candidate division Zixibacteria bacterium]